ncbi:MAG: hypothetical protein KBD78_03820 [Oligoflexales bacterium]|nr:hypothetical protein [Oligoflexales bacterium]
MQQVSRVNSKSNKSLHKGRTAGAVEVDPQANKTKLPSAIVTQYCNHCGSDDCKAKTREISIAAWSALLEWQEISTDAVCKPICQACYDELRNILIERADEIRLVKPNPAIINLQVEFSRIAS